MTCSAPETSIAGALQVTAVVWGENSAVPDAEAAGRAHFALMLGARWLPCIEPWTLPCPRINEGGKCIPCTQDLLVELEKALVLSCKSAQVGTITSCCIPYCFDYRIPLLQASFCSICLILRLVWIDLESTVACLWQVPQKQRFERKPSAPHVYFHSAGIVFCDGIHPQPTAADQRTAIQRLRLQVEARICMLRSSSHLCCLRYAPPQCDIALIMHC